MRRIESVLRLPLRDKSALARAAGMVSLTRLALAVMPFRRVLSVADSLAARRRRRASTVEEKDRMLRAVEKASRALLARGPCLSQAIVADVILRRRGFPSHLHLGVARGAGGEMRAHAWVESEGRVVVGGAESPGDFVALPDPRVTR